jgi:hypothetical protein
MRAVVLLGPQRFEPTLRSVVDSLAEGGRVAAVTAGWQERESEDVELRDHLGGRLVNLRLHGRAEELFAADPELFNGLRRRQERLKQLQAIYRLRLDHQLAAARELFARAGSVGLLGPEREDAIAAIRALDDHHLARVLEVHRHLDAPWPAPDHPELEHHRREIAAELAECDVLAIAGGHVAVLLNRLRLFRVLELARDKPVVAWSAGAMALAERVVLFHDSPPWGQGNAEVLDAGLELLGSELAGAAILPLPHAGRRLRLGDPVRVSLLAQRFAPLAPFTLDAGDRLLLAEGRILEAVGSRRLLADGTLAAEHHRPRTADATVSP